MLEVDAQRLLDEVWRAEAPRIVGALARRTGDVDLAEDLAQEALAQALETWPHTGSPRSPGAWLTTVASRRAIDEWRRRSRREAHDAELARDLREAEARSGAEGAADSYDPDRIDDDVLRLIFVACHPVLSRESQIALTLRVVAGLTTVEIGRALLVPVATAQQRIVRAKKTLRAARVPFEVPTRDEYPARLAAVLGVVYLLFNEGYVATSGDALLRVDVADEARRLGRILQHRLPREPEAHALVALMELQASRFAARVDAAGDSILLSDQDRTLWDAQAIARGRDALTTADALARGRGPYALQAAIAEVHAAARTPDYTDWDAIVVLYDALVALTGSPVVELNRAVAVSMATGPATALPLVDALEAAGDLERYAPFHAVRGDLLSRLDRSAEARAAFVTAAGLSTNERERAVLADRADDTTPRKDAP
ncbi:RNA polymerase sigma factor [Frondihabitans peucedani]|uniref:RNA polymerase sigma factor n=1 Tax=Frondihabitans peucedani TaxID=598626 RepID=A0ABP8E0W6_9MICO